MAGKTGKEELEAFADAFVAGTASPATPDRLRVHGLQRVLARARAAEAHGTPAATSRAYRNPAMLRHALIVAVAAVLVMVLSTSGAYAFSLDAQPDSTLYGAKIFFERARIALNLSNTEDMCLEMRFSERRMEELRNMVAAGNQDGAERWLHEYGRNVEGAGILFASVSAQDAAELSARFLEMLELQAQMMQGMRYGQPPGLSGPIEDAYQICEGERERMRRRCGQRERGGSEQEPGGEEGQGDGNRPRMEDSDSPQETSSSDGPGPTGDGQAAAEEDVSASSPSGDDTMDIPAGSPAATPMSTGGQSAAGVQMSGDTWYRQGDMPARGHMP